MNVLLVTIDSLRADHVYDDLATTPTLDELQEDGERYESAFAQGPFTTFSMPSLFTSKYPSGLKYLELSDSTIGVYIDNEATLPESLNKTGYDTAGFHSNPLLSHLFGFDRGFDTFDSRLPLSNIEFLSGQAKVLVDKLLRVFRKHAYLPAERLNERALDWLDQRYNDGPFFLWLHYMDVHGPYQAKTGNAYVNKYRAEQLWRKAANRPDEITGTEHERLKELYRVEVEYADRCLGTLLGRLRERGVYDETMTIVTADHGEQFNEHGFYSHPHQLYDELTRVPLIIDDPGRTSETVLEVVELLNIGPTLLQRLAIEIPESFVGDPLDGRNTDDNAISEANLTPNYTGAIRGDQWKYILDETKGTEELYDLDDDPDEQHDVIEDYPEVHEQFATRLEEHVSTDSRSVGPDCEITQQEIENEMVKDRLKDLGYLD